MFLRVRAHGDGSRFRSMTVRTGDEPRRDVRLGTVGDHVQPTAVRREPTSLVSTTISSSRDDLGDRVRLLVVDNASNLELEPTDAHRHAGRAEPEPRRCRRVRTRLDGAA